MACSCVSIITSPVTKSSKGAWMEQDNFRRSFSRKGTREKAQMRRAYSENHLCCRANRIQSSETQPKLKTSRSTGGPFKLQLSSSFLPDSLRSFLFDIETSKEIDIKDVIFETGHDHDHDNGMEVDQDETRSRSNWIRRLVELRRNWIEKQKNDGAEMLEDNMENSGGDCEEEGCEVDYEDENDAVEEVNIDRESFSRLLRRVSWSDAKLFSQLAFLCNMAYVIPEIKARDLERCYGLDFVTSSLVKKAEAMAIKAKFDKDSIRVPVPSTDSPVSDPCKTEQTELKRLSRPLVAYDIAASAAAYVQSRAKDLLSLGSESKLIVDDATLKVNKEYSADEKELSQRVYKSERAAYVAASTMTTMVAADEKQKLEAAKDLQSLQSSPCEWFICDDLTTYTRCFVIQGSDSLASWQANLFFEPSKFEEMDVLVHRGIYEAAKGIYDQFMPEIMEHLQRFGNKAKFQFTGHSLGGSLSLLVNLMLLTRKIVKPSSLLPVVTFGSPFVFCGGQKVLDDLGLDENHVQCVMMHRDIVPRAFSCNYPNHVAQVLKRLNSTFRSHPCLNKNKLLYSPLGKIFIIQPDEKSSAPHPLLPPGSGLYSLDNTHCAFTGRAFRAFLNSPHPLEILSDPTAYGSGGTILRDHDSSNYLKAVNSIIRQRTKLLVRRVRKQRNLIWPLLASQSPHAWSHERTIDTRELLRKEIMTGV